MNKFDDIIPPSRRRAHADAPSGRPGPHTPMSSSLYRNEGFPHRTTTVAVLVIIAAIGALIYFGGAKVEISPTSFTANASGTFTATLGEGTLPFEVIKSEKVATQNVVGSGSKEVSASASGSVTIYNTQSKDQPLIANTRFATKTGLVFRIHKAITVPKGTDAKPGSVTTTIYADKPGDTYNVGPTSFSLPGLAGTPQATQVYAVSSTPMSGGVSGKVPVIDAATESQARTALVAALGPDLTKALRETLPEGYVLIPGSATTTFVSQTPSTSATTDMVEVRELGLISAVVFPEEALASAVGRQVLGNAYIEGTAMHFDSVENLHLVSNAVPTTGLTSYTFSLSGSSQIVYDIDTERIKSAIAGKPKTSAEVILSNFPEIKRAYLILRPFWKKTFPEDPASIEVTVTAPERG